MTDMQYGQDEEKKRRNRMAAATIAEAENKALTKKGSMDAIPEQPAKKRPTGAGSAASRYMQRNPMTGGSDEWKRATLFGRGQGQGQATPDSGGSPSGIPAGVRKTVTPGGATSYSQDSVVPLPPAANAPTVSGTGIRGLVVQTSPDIHARYFTTQKHASRQAAAKPAAVEQGGAGGGGATPQGAQYTGDGKVPLDINMVGAPTNIQAIRQNPAAYSQVNEMGHGMGLTNMYNRLANQMRQDRLSRQGERERRELLQQALTTPNAQYYNMSTEEGSLKAAQGRQQAALEALGITGKERAAQAEQLGRGEAAARQERQQDRAYNLQERGLQNREALAEQAARAEGRKQQQKAQERRGDLTGAGKAYFDARTEAMKLYRGGEMTQEEMDAVEQTALMAAADFGRAAGQYVDPNKGYKLITQKEVEAMAKAQGMEVDEFVRAFGLIGGPR